MTDERQGSDPPRVCIIGAGLAGLSVAAAADGRNVDITIMEVKDSIEPLGGGIILQPNAIFALDQLECLDAVREAGTQLTDIVQYREQGAVAITLSEIWPGLGLPTIAVHRHALHAVLMESANENATVKLSCRVVDVRPSRDDRICVITADGKEGIYDLVVGADGIQSSVRAFVAPDAEIRQLGLWWARWLVDGGSSIARRWQTQRLDRIVVGTFPLGSDELQVFATIPSDIMSSSGQKDTLTRLERESDVLREATEHGMRLVHVGPAREVRPHVWRGCGIALAGDAAHAMSPTLSAGGSLAIEDGLVLGRLLGKGGQMGRITSRYEQLRKWRLEWMARVGQVQICTMRGAPGNPSRTELARQLRSMYGPLDDPAYIPDDLTGNGGGRAG